MIPLGTIQQVFSAIAALKFARDAQEVVMSRIRLQISCLGEPLQKSLDLYMQGSAKSEKKTSMEVLKDQLTAAYQKMYTISKRNSCIRFAKAKQDLQTLESCSKLIEQGIKLIQAEKDIIQLSLAKQEQNIKNKQYETVSNKLKNEKSKDFWITHVGADKAQEPIYNFVQKFYNAEFSTVGEEEIQKKIKKQYAIAQLLMHMDQDGSGYIDMEELNDFYQQFWDNQDDQKLIIDKVLADQEQPLNNHTQIMGSILEEQGLQRLITSFISMKMTSCSFLNLDLNALMQITSKESAISIYNGICQFKNYQQKFHDIRDFLISIRGQASYLLVEYNKAPKKWEPGYSGICSFYNEHHCGTVVIQSLRGICSGPYIMIHDQVYDWCPMYGFMVNFDPAKHIKCYQYYEAVYITPEESFYQKNRIEYFTYYDKDRCWGYQIRNPDNRSYNMEKQFNVKNEKYENWANMNFKHGPSISYDSSGNCVRIYYYQDIEVSFEDYQKYCKENTMLRNDIKDIVYEPIYH